MATLISEIQDLIKAFGQWFHKNRCCNRKGVSKDVELVEKGGNRGSTSPRATNVDDTDVGSEPDPPQTEPRNNILGYYET